MSDVDMTRAPKLLVTVGSTTFPALISYILTSPDLHRVLPARTEIWVQYGRSDLATILTSPHVHDDGGGGGGLDASALSVHARPQSAKHPEPGLRNDPKHGLTWKGSHARQTLDPGLEGEIIGWRVGVGAGARSNSQGQRSDADDAAFSFTTAPRTITLHSPSPRDITLHLFDFTSDLKDHIDRADIVISHAGSGSLLDVLRSPIDHPPPLLILVPNVTLMDNHQVQLARAVETGGWARHASVSARDQDQDGKGLAVVLQEVLAQWRAGKAPVQFPRAQPSRFADVVQEMLEQR